VPFGVLACGVVLLIIISLLFLSQCFGLKHGHGEFCAWASPLFKYIQATEICGSFSVILFLVIVAGETDSSIAPVECTV
jgi:hypothetical protein